MKRTLDWDKYLEKAAETVAEGIVMLKNDNNALPLDTSKTVSVFGRIQLHYYKSYMTYIAIGTKKIPLTRATAGAESLGTRKKCRLMRA